MIGITFSGLAGRAAEKVASFPAAGREGSSLPPGWLNTRGSQIVDNRGNVLRIASIGWYGTDGPAGTRYRVYGPLAIVPYATALWLLASIPFAFLGRM